MTAPDPHVEALLHVQALRELLATFTHRDPRGGTYTTLDAVGPNLDAIDWTVRLHAEVTAHDL